MTHFGFLFNEERFLEMNETASKNKHAKKIKKHAKTWF